MHLKFAWFFWLVRVEIGGTTLPMQQRMIKLHLQFFEEQAQRRAPTAWLAIGSRRRTEALYSRKLYEILRAEKMYPFRRMCCPTCRTDCSKIHFSFTSWPLQHCEVTRALMIVNFLP